ncbi:MAG: ABC transporter permease [Clostridiales Family XIII bacterium]|jgi:ABC-2 type transport system permease protein|nr:ABC transporter permease [Clostridiales Family XIII bacterium]
MKYIWEVFKFEYKGFVGAKSFRIVTIIFVCALLILTFIPEVVHQVSSLTSGADKAEKTKAAFVLGETALENELYTAAFAPDLLSAAVPAKWTDGREDGLTEEQLKEKVGAGDYLFAFYYNGGSEFKFYAPGNKITAYTSLAPLSVYITEVARQAAILELPETVRTDVARVAAIEAEPVIVDIGGNAENNFWIGYVLMFFLFYVIMGYSNAVSGAVVTEKTSKAMELLITVAKPVHLMVGKVLGIGFASLTQVGAMVAAAGIGIAVNLPRWKDLSPDLFDMLTGSNVSGALIGILLVYFFLGFFVYAFLAAAMGSMVSKPEEAASVMTMPMLMLVAGMALGFLTLSGVMNKTLAAALSYVPFFTPFCMISRYTLGDAGTGSIVLGAIVLAAAVCVVAWIAAKIFRMGVMLYGVKATPKQIRRALFG